MPKRIASLTDLQISRVKPQEKQKALFDGGGLYLLVTPAGGKLWRFKYRFSGQEKILALGAYPEIPLGEARQRRDEARKHLANGVISIRLVRPQQLRGSMRVSRSLPANGAASSPPPGQQAMPRRP